MESQMEDRRELILVFDPINILWSYLKGKLPIRESSGGMVHVFLLSQQPGFLFELQ